MAQNVASSAPTKKPLFPKKKVTAPIEEKKHMEEDDQYDMADTTNEEPVPEFTNSLLLNDSLVRRLSLDCPVS